MNRTEIIDNIIQKRRSQVDEVARRQEILNSVRSSLSTMQQTLPGMRDYLQDVEGVQLALDNTKQVIGGLEGLLNRLQARYGRKTLNIGIVGVPKQGKSTFLQSLTGLDEATVPTGDVWVTGAPSYLLNDSAADETYAEVHFYTREEFLKDVIRPFFIDLGASPISSLELFPNCTLPDVKESSVASKKLKRLSQLQRHFHEYEKYLGSGSTKVEKKVIRRYVAQHDESGEVEYSTWYAVRFAEIHCRFPQTDVGKVMVCDTPGLGDFTAGAKEKLTHTMYHDMDIVFMLKRPDLNNQNVTREDAEFIDTIDDPANAFKVGEWTYIIVNEKADVKDGIKDSYIRALKEDLRCPRLFRLNAKDVDDVSRIFNNILEDVVQQVPLLDAKLRDAYDSQIGRLKEALRSLHEAASSVTRSTPKSQRAYTAELAIETLGHVKVKLDALKKEYSQEDVLSTPEFRSKLEEVVEDLKTPPQLTWTNIAMPSVWMADNLASLRACFLERFGSLDGVLDDMIIRLRDSVREILVSEDGGRLGFVLQGSQHENEEAFWALLKDCMTETCPTGVSDYWIRAIDTLLEVKLPFRSFLLPHIVRVLDIFDSEKKQTDPLVRSYQQFESGDSFEMCRNKLEQLWDCAREQVCDMLLKAESESVESAAITVPGKALLASIEEFSFYWLRGGGVRKSDANWQIFYDEISTQVWPDLFNNPEAPFRIAKSWNDSCKALKHMEASL